MAVQDDPIKRLRVGLGLDQEPFGKELGVSQSRVSEWEKGEPLSPRNAAQLWERYGSRLRGMGCRFRDLLGHREPTDDGDGERAA